MLRQPPVPDTLSPSPDRGRMVKMGLSSTEQATTAFEERFGAVPTLLSRAPGRVNLMGDHTDYNGLPVFPMAVQREVRIALRPRDDGMVVLHDADPAFDPVQFEIAPRIPPAGGGDWGDYVRAPANELARRFAIWRGFDGVLDSDVPIAAGLSSSSAIVNAVGLALAHINEVPVDERTFPPLMADAERYTGTRGGGMDQAISLGAREGCACKITFHPLRLRHVPVPADWSFIVADSGARAAKSGAVQKAYNLRREECEEALGEIVQEVVRVGAARTTPGSYPALLRSLRPADAIELAEGVLKGNLLKRFRHVITEAGRVEEAVERLRAADISGFGTLMDASHGSLRTDFHVSTAELDELTAIAREGGAVGARLTGAGFGGCIVALADPTCVDSVLDTLASEYYGPRKIDDVESHLFVAEPSAGASFTRLT